MGTAIVVFTRDLRRHDNPALHLACARARQVVPLFVLDPAWLQTPWKLPSAQRERLGYRARSWSCPEQAAARSAL